MLVLIQRRVISIVLDNGCCISRNVGRTNINLVTSNSLYFLFITLIIIHVENWFYHYNYQYYLMIISKLFHFHFLLLILINQAMNLIAWHLNYCTVSFYINKNYFITHLQYFYSSLWKVQSSFFSFFNNKKHCCISGSI